MSTETLRETTENRGNVSAPTPPRAWEAPRLTYVGHVAKLLQTGGGKLSPQGGDPGENRKQQPIG